jgi:hypothetical protein
MAGCGLVSVMRLFLYSSLKRDTVNSGTIINVSAVWIINNAENFYPVQELLLLEIVNFYSHVKF